MAAALIRCASFGSFERDSALIATQARSTDLYNLRRRRRSLSLGASMQWDLLPPLVLKTERVTVAGLLEPAYEVGGDCFDYALNDAAFDVAIVDAMGHGITSSLIAALTIGSYRHDRREGRTLEHMHESLDTALATHLPQPLFATGQLARVDLESGVMTWTNAGHPHPLHIRNGQVLAELDCPTSLPWGLGALDPESGPPTIATVGLEPGDGVLFFTDGITEEHLSGGDLFGETRLIELLEEVAREGGPVQETVRRLSHALKRARGEVTNDDATLFLLEWRGGSADHLAQLDA